MSKGKRFLSMACCALIVCAPTAAAQFDRGTITGTVTDPSGALVPQAQITATNMDTGVPTQGVTNEVGLYRFSNIPIGRYEIKISAPGFKTHTRSGVTLTVAQTLRLDVTLETGTVQESVTVSAEASLLKLGTAQVSTTIQSRVVTDLPLSFAGGRWVSDPFVGNLIPKSRMSTVSSKIIDIYKKSYLPMIPDRLTNNSTRTQYNAPWFHQTQLTFKGDHAVSASNKFSGSLIWTQRPRILADAGGVWDPLDPDKWGGPFARSRKQEVTSRAVRLSNNWTIRPNLINTASFAYNRYRNPSLSTQINKGWNKYLGLDKYTSAGLFPEISFGSAVNGVAITQIGYNSSGYYVGNTYIMGDNVIWVRGRHTFKFGGQFWKQQINSHSGLDTLSFSFANSTTGVPGETWSHRVGFGFASFFLGEVASASKAVPFDLYGRRNYRELFGQDDVKVSDRLTLNLGLRWEQAGRFHEKFARWANFNPEVMNTRLKVKGALEFLSGPGDSFERNQDWKEFSPRIGGAYRLSSKAVLRAGYGIFFIPIGINYWGGVPYSFAPGYRGTNRGSSRYDSFQLQLTKRMSHGVAAQASYNLSKAVGNVETAFDETWDATGGIQDIHDLALDAKTVLPYDQRHILKGYIQYQLPFGRGRKYLSTAPAWLNAIVGGWDVTWMFKYNTGGPLGITPNVWYPGWDGAVYADWDQSVDLSRKFDTKVFNPGKQDDPVNLYFDRSAFSNPKDHKLGNGRRRYNELRGFGWSNEDMGLLKYFRFTESISLQVRAEFLNLFNRHHYANPNTGLANQTNFGYVTGMTGTPRNVQVGLRLGW